MLRTFSTASTQSGHTPEFASIDFTIAIVVRADKAQDG
jgi:hypothetical protein